MALPYRTFDRSSCDQLGRDRVEAIKDWATTGRARDKTGTPETECSGFEHRHALLYPVL
jgi:hypothetical protein